MVLSAFQPLRGDRSFRGHHPFPLKKCCSVPETFSIIAHENIFHYLIYFSQKPTLFKGRRGTNALSRITNMQGVPGLLASIVGIILKNDKGFHPRTPLSCPIGACHLFPATSLNNIFLCLRKCQVHYIIYETFGKAVVHLLLFYKGPPSSYNTL